MVLPARARLISTIILSLLMVAGTRSFSPTAHSLENISMALSQ